MARFGLYFFICLVEILFYLHTGLHSIHDRHVYVQNYHGVVISRVTEHHLQSI